MPSLQANWNRGFLSCGREGWQKGSGKEREQLQKCYDPHFPKLIQATNGTSHKAPIDQLQTTGLLCYPIPMAASTKERILDAAEELMLTKSFHSVGLSEILAAVKVPKGSFYHYFSSKEQFGVELISHYVQRHTERLQQGFAAKDTNALQKFCDYWAYQIGLFTGSGCQHCCLVVKLSLEVANFSETMRDVLAQGMRSWRGIFENAIKEGQADGSIRKDLKPAEAAAVVQDIWQGAMQRMQVERTAAPLRTAAQFLQSYLAAK